MVESRLSLYTALQVVAATGMSPETVHRLARRYGIGRLLVMSEVGNKRVFTRAEAHKLLWIHLNPGYRGKLPWAYPEARAQPEPPWYTELEVINTVGRGAPWLRKLREKDPLIGDVVDRWILYTPTDIQRIREYINEPQAQHRPWHGNIKNPDRPKLSIDKKVLHTYDGIVEDHMAEEEKTTKGDEDRVQLSVYMPRDLYDWIESKRADATYRRRSYLIVEAVARMKQQEEREDEKYNER